MSLNPSVLPDPLKLRRRLQALAMLDAIVCPEWENRYYSFDASWSANEAMGSRRNGSGDDWHILFGAFGTAIKGFSHERPLSGGQRFADQVQTELPRSFSPFLCEPAFSMDDINYCYWQEAADTTWHKVMNPDEGVTFSEDGSSEELELLCESAAAYVSFASEYFEMELSIDAVEAVFAHTPMTKQLAQALRPDVSFSLVKKDAKEIGYPIAK